MLAFELAGGEAAVGPFLDGLQLPTIAVSLGDVSTLIWPLAGSGVFRLSVGLEDLADLEADFRHALDQLTGSDNAANRGAGERSRSARAGRWRPPEPAAHRGWPERAAGHRT